MDYLTFEIDMEVKEKDNKEDFQEKRAKKTSFSRSQSCLSPGTAAKQVLEATTTSPLHLNYTNVVTSWLKPLGK